MTNEDHTEAGSLLLDEQLCFALYAAQRALTAAYRPLLDELGLTYPQYLVLLVLWERGETPIKDLATALHLDYGTLSPLLKRLESAGLVHRERAAHDERSVLVACTERGTALRGARRLSPARCSRRRNWRCPSSGGCGRSCGGSRSARRRRRKGLADRPTSGYRRFVPPGRQGRATGQYLVHDVVARSHVSVPGEVPP